LVLTGETDPAAAILALSSLKIVSPEVRRNWTGIVRDAIAYRPAEWEASQSKKAVHSIDLCRAINRFVAEHPDATLICDGGEFAQWPQALIKASDRLINGVSGTIGVSIPFAIAAKAASPMSPVISLVGDGAFGFHMAELDTALRYDLPIIVVVGNDARWNAEHQTQLRSYGADRTFGCELMPTRYDLVAEALGGFGLLVTRVDELANALGEALASRKPACINVMIESVAAPRLRRQS
jgi:acetolactate synthase I/II/III large subunit